MKPIKRLLSVMALAGALFAGMTGGASAQTYTSGSTTYNFVDSSAHTKIGYNSTPYKFNQSSGCGTTPPILDDTLSDSIPIGFTFTFGATNFTNVYVMSNGRLQFGNTTCGSGTSNIGPPQTYPYGYPDSSMNNTMKIFGVDLDPTNLVDKANYPTSAKKTPCAAIATCYVSVASIGNAPARQFVVTWKNVPEWVTASNTSGSFDLQIILNEDGSFVYQYGNNISHGGTGTAQVGWQISTSNYQVLSFGAATEPTANSAIKFFLPAPLAFYAFDESTWASGVANQVLDSSASARSGTALGNAQTASAGKVCRAADIPLNTTGPSVDAVRTGVNISNSALSLLGTGTVTFWYRSNAAWSGQSAQLLDATAVNGEWFFLTKTATGALLFEVKDSAGTVRSVTTPAQSFASNTWVHIAVTWNFNGNAGTNQDNLQVFINAGTPTVSAFTSSGTVTQQAGFLHMGDNAFGTADTQGSVNSANGMLDEVQIYNYALTTAQVNTAMNTTRTCAAFVIDHLEIQHANGSGLTCAPSTITVRACQNASCSTLYTGGISGVLNATGSPAINWDSSTGGATGSKFTIPSGSSSVTKSFQITTTGNLLLGMGGLSPSPSTGNTCNFGSPSCTFTVTDAGFIFTVANHVADVSQSVAISAVKKADNSNSCVPAFVSATKAVKFSCSYINPSTGTLPMRVGGVATNATARLDAACDASSVAVKGADVNLAFNASGVATTTVQYADVGNQTLSARYAPSSGPDSNLVMTGASSFFTRPKDFVLSAIRCSLIPAGNCAADRPANNPAAASDMDPAFIGAGMSFSVTVTSVNASGTVTPNYGRETSPEGVKLSASLVAPSGGILPALTNPSGFGTFTAGVATGTTFAFSEVGIIKLTPSVADGDYLGQGDVTGTPSANVGRFVPARFALSGGTATHRVVAACPLASTSIFTYLDENFRLGFALTAQNTTGGTTQNYNGTYAKLNLATAANWKLDGVDGSTSFTTRVSVGTSSGTWINGVAAGITLTANVGRQSTPNGPPDGPFNANIGIAPVDPDGVQMASHDIDVSLPAGNDHTKVATVPLRFGRLRLSNSMGPQDRVLNIPLAVQYWDGSKFIDNADDSCTVINANSVNFGNYRKTLGTADSSLASTSYPVKNGKATLVLNRPGGSRSGSFDLSVSLGNTTATDSCIQGFAPGVAATVAGAMPWLRGAWCNTNYVKDPSARATFGLYRGTSNLIYQRENY